MKHTDSSSIETLKVLTENLPSLPSLVQTSFPGVKTYRTSSGAIIGFNLLHEKDIAVSRFFLSEGAVFDYNLPKGGAQIFNVLEGSVLLDRESREQKCEKGYVFVVRRKVPRKITALADTWLLIITMPTDAGLPD